MREGIIRLWFDMWLQQEDLGIDKIFTEDILYIESWGPTYEGRALVKHWFEEWNTRGKVLKWDIQQYFTRANKRWWNGISKIPCTMGDAKNLTESH